ncbi:MAG: PAS domain S-box protein, partial [Bacteroidota bacterium]
MDHILNRPLVKFIHPDQTERIESAIQRCIQSDVFEAWNFVMIDVHHNAQVVNLCLFQLPGTQALQIIGQPIGVEHNDAQPTNTIPSNTSDDILPSVSEEQNLKRLSGSFSWELDSNRFFGSHDLFHMLGFPGVPSDFKVEQFFRQVHPQDVDELRTAMHPSDKDAPHFEKIFRFWKRNGTICWAFISGKAYFNQDGSISFLAGTCLDLTRQIRIEQDLKITKNRYQAMFDNAFDGILLMKDRMVIDCNASISRLTGFPKEQIIGKRPLDFIADIEGSPEQRMQRANHLFKALGEGKPILSLWRIRNRQGEIVPVEVRMQSLEIGKEPHYLSFLRDLSEQYHLDKKKALLESVIENSDDAFITIHRNEETGRHYISHVNPAFEELSGFDRTYLIERPAEFWYKFIGNKEKTDSIRQFVRERTPYETEMQVVRKSEEPLWVNFSLKPVATKEDDYVICRLKNIHSKVNRETIMEQFFRLGSDGFAIFDSQGFFRHASLAWEQMLGYSISQLKRKTALELIHPEDLEQSAIGFEALFEGKEIKGWYNRYRHQEGHYVDLLWNVIPDSSNDRFFASARDVTSQMILMRELEKAKVLLEEKVATRTKELEKSNERLEQFAFIASHDLRAPLRTISSFLGLLERKITDKLTEREMELFQFVLKGAKDMNGLIEAILAYSRAQRAVPNFEVFDGAKVIQSVNTAFESKLKEYDGRVEIHQLPKLHGDRIMFRQIMQNLISN